LKDSSSPSKELDEKTVPSVVDPWFEPISHCPEHKKDPLAIEKAFPAERIAAY